MLKPGQHLYLGKGQSQKGSVDGISAQIQIDADKHLWEPYNGSHQWWMVNLSEKNGESIEHKVGRGHSLKLTFGSGLFVEPSKTRHEASLRVNEAFKFDRNKKT